MTAFRLELRRTRGLLVWLAAALAGYGAVMGLLYPFMLENSKLIEDYINAFPAEFLAAFGMTGALSDPGVFFTTYVASWLWPIVAAVAALLAGTRVPVDLDRGFLDLPLATPLSRTRLLLASIAVQVLLMAVLALAAVGSIWAVATLVGADFDPVGYALAGVLSFAFGCAIAGPATLLSVVTLSRGTTSAIVGGILAAMYAIFVVTQIAADDWGWLAPLSFWDHYRTTEVIDDLVVPAFDLALFALIAVGAWAAALWVFRRRDLAA